MGECELPEALSRKKRGVLRGDICPWGRRRRWIAFSWNSQSSFITCGSGFEDWSW